MDEFLYSKHDYGTNEESRCPKKLMKCFSPPITPIDPLLSSASHGDGLINTEHSLCFGIVFGSRNIAAYFLT